MIGSIANNRFLHRVNPEIKRALNETGAAASMRQMVDLDIAKNLVGWWHRDNVNTRVSGSDTFVTQANDSSGGTNDAIQTTEANQPKLVSLGMEFDGSDDYLNCGQDDSLQITVNLTVMMWVKNIQSDRVYTICKWLTTGNNRQWLIGITANGEMVVIIDRDGDNANRKYYVGTTTVAQEDAWHLIGFTFAANDLRLYVDGSEETVTKTSDPTINAMTAVSANLIIAQSDQGTGNNTGIYSDVRVFSKALSASEITAIHNQTKGAYGL